MANQPPARPWFRLPSITRPTPTPATAPPPPSEAPQTQPQPQPQPRPRPPLARPAFRTIAQLQPQPTEPQQPTPAPSTNGVSSLPTSPAAPRAYAPSSSLPTSPAKTTSGSVPSSPKLGAIGTATSSVPSSPAPRPATTISSVPTSPAKPLPATSSVPTSPEPKPVITTTTAAITPELPPAPAPSPRIIQPVVRTTPPESPKPKPSAPPPSPLALPPAQIKSDEPPKIPLEAEQKTVLVQKTIDKPKLAGPNGTDHLKPIIARLEKLEVSKDMEPKPKTHRKKFSSDSEEKGMRVITIAGENKGAFMEVFHSSKKHVFESNNAHILNLHTKGEGHKLGSSSSSGSSSSEEGKVPKIKSHKGKGMASSSPPMSAFANSNVQGVNNSIVYNSSCTHHDPGVHVALYRKPTGGVFHIKEHDVE